MRSWRGALGGLALLLGSLAPSAQAAPGLRLQLHDAGLSVAQRQVSQTLLDAALAALPPRLRQQLDRTVRVRWSDTLPAEVYGRLSRRDALLLNARLLPALADGSAARQPSRRTHGSLQRELLATLLHELAHLYDRERAWPADTVQLIRRCRQQADSRGLAGLPGACRGQTERRFTLSDDPRLLDLAGWAPRSGQRGARMTDNPQWLRSPDTYELSNPREFLAVNLEYFLLDPDYACRRPSLHRYLREHFAWAPPASSACASELAFLNAGSDFARQPLGRLDPERIYAVDYLFAEANDDWASRWGHSMLRLVVCAPGRPRGPDCRLDLDQHLVLSFRAFVGDVQLSSWDGLTGAYPSRLFILPLAQVIDEYTKTELRSLASLPLRLSRTQIHMLSERAAELHWSHDGDYWFLSNNCAVETLQLLRSGSADPRLADLDSITPSGLLALLEARGLLDRSVLDEPSAALRLGYRFDSFRARYQAMFAIARAQLHLPQPDLEAWLALPAQHRRTHFAADLRSSAALLLLEQAARRRQLQQAQADLKHDYLRRRSGDSRPSADRTLEQLLASSGYLSRPAELLDGGYGLPQAGEWQRLEQQSSQRQARLRQLSDQLDAQLLPLLSAERRRELEDGEANLEVLGEQLRELHRAEGGLLLP